MKVTLDIDLVNCRISICDEFGNTDDATPVGHDFWEVCPDHIGYSLNIFLSNHWNDYQSLVKNPEFQRLCDQYEKLLIEKHRLLVKLEKLEKQEEPKEPERR